jgi:ribosomal protein L37AE/L43A
MAKKLGPAGRFGVRYGKSIKKKVNEVERKLRSWHKCPYCSKMKVKRLKIFAFFGLQFSDVRKSHFYFPNAIS